MVIERSTGGAALVLIIVILVIMFIASDVEINIEGSNDTEENFTGSRTLHKLNPQPQSCEQCINNCKWTTLRTEEKCREECVGKKYC